MPEFLTYSPNPIESIHDEDCRSRITERQRQRLVRITDFIARRGLIGRMHDGNGRRLALLDVPYLDTVKPATLDTYLAQSIRAEQAHTFNNCFQIAREAHTDGSAMGILEANEGTERLALASNHRINYDRLEDGSVVAVDLTARANILGQDDNQFDVLALRAPSLDVLLPWVGELYGGNWHEVHPDNY